MGFPDSSVGKESACNAGDPGLIPGLVRDCLISAPDSAGKSRHQYASVKDKFHYKIFLQEIQRSPGTGEFYPCTCDYAAGAPAQRPTRPP